LPIDRPTFSETWYRVAELKPHLLSSVQVHRQQFRGHMWHVLQDPANNQFFRLNEAAYRFVALLDGRRTVSDAWKISNDQFGDMSPTQGEVIQLLGQLYSSNLLQADLPPDSEGLFKRYKKRVGREVKGYVSNLLFIRIPLLDPDRFLDRWVGVVGWIYSWFGLLVWLGILSVGGWFVISNWDAAVAQASDIFKQMLEQQRLAGNAALMFACFWGIKIFHEFSHGFACKKFGVNSGSGGEVHVMGIMFMVFTPIPYVDASSSWAFRHKWHRMMVGLAGMYVELAIAAVAAVVWASTPDKTLIHSVAYNVMLIGSVTTILFNGNPLLRYDGYYILSDLLEIPNLAQRSKDYLYYLVKRYVWRVRKPRNPAHTVGERFWFVLYGISSTIYRTFIVAAILYFVYRAIPVLGAVLATAAIAAWLFAPLYKFFAYLFTNQELSRTRGLAVATTAAFIALLVVGLGYVPCHDRIYAPGVVEPQERRVVNALSEGLVTFVAPTDTFVRAGQPLVVADNRDFVTALNLAQTELKGFKLDRQQAVKHMRDVTQHDETIRAQNKRISDARKEVDDLTLTSPIAGTWVTQNPHLMGYYAKRTEPFGEVISSKLVIRVAVSQEDAPRIVRECLDDPERSRVEIRVEGRPDLMMTGHIAKVERAATKRLPQALGVGAGGPVTIDPSDRHGTTSEQEMLKFVIEVDPPAEGQPPIASGQRVVVQFNTPWKPLASQWWLKIIRLLPTTLQPS